MASPQDMIDAIEAALLAYPAGVVTIRYADGRSIQYDRKQAIDELAYWQRQVAAQAGSGLIEMRRMNYVGDF
jgi:hypothetical protein